MIIIYDLINILILIILILFLNNRKYLNNNLSVILLISCFLPLFWNDFFISRHYFPDQRNYYDLIQSIRSFEWPKKSTFNIFYGYLNAFSPIPFLERINSIGFVNKFYFILFLSYIYSNFKFTNKIYLYILPLYPSLLIYSLMSLRETLIVINMLLIFIFLLNKKYLYLTISIIILFNLKIYYFIIILPVIFLYIIFIILLNKKNFSANYILKNNTNITLFNNLNIHQFFLLLFSMIIFFIIIYFEKELIFNINKLRWNAWYEAYSSRNNFFDYENLYYFLLNFPLFLFKFSFYPLITSADNLFKIIVSIEVFFSTLFISYLFLNLIKIKKYQESLFWFLTMIYFSVLIAGIIENIGTLSRYRLPFYISFIFVLLLENKFLKKINNEKI